jgi:hypothetical protein
MCGRIRLGAETNQRIVQRLASGVIRGDISIGSIPSPSRNGSEDDGAQLERPSPQDIRLSAKKGDTLHDSHDMGQLDVGHVWLRLAGAPAIKPRGLVCAAGGTC